MKINFINCIFIIFFASLATSWGCLAQNPNSQITVKSQKKKEQKKRANDVQMQQNFGSQPPTQQNYQGTGRELTTKVKFKSKRQIRKIEAKTASYSGKEKVNVADIKKKRAERSKEMAYYAGNVKYVDIAKERGKKNRKLANYSGSLSMSKLKSRKRKIRDKMREIAAFSGNERYVNIGKMRKRKDQKIAKFKGPNPIRIRKKPKGSITSFYKGAPNKNRVPANYNKKAFRSGRVVKKSQLPNYQKSKPGKYRYNSRETKMWQSGGGALPKKTERKLPKNKKTKGSKDNLEPQQGE